MRHAKALTVLSAVMILSFWGSVAVAQVYAGESEPGWIVSYEGALGTVVNPDIEVPGVRGMTIDEFGRLLIAAFGDQGDVLLFDVETQALETLEYHQSAYTTEDVYPDPADSNIYVIKNGGEPDGERCDSYLGVLYGGVGPAGTIYTFGTDDTLLDLQVWPMGDRAGNILVLVESGLSGFGFLSEFEKTGTGSFVRLPDVVEPGAMVAEPGGFAITPEGSIVIVDRESGLYHEVAGAVVPFGEADGPRYTDMEIGSDGTIYLVNSESNVVERYDEGGLRILPDLTGGITNPTAVTAASFSPTPEGENVFVEPISGVEITYEEVTSAGFTTAVAESSQNRVSPEGNLLPDYAVVPGARADDQFLYISISTEADYRSLIQVDVLMEGSRLFYAGGVSDTFRDFTVVGSIEDARGTMPRFCEIGLPGGSRLETGPTEVVLVDDTRELSQVTLYKFWRLEKAMEMPEAVPYQNSCPWEVMENLQAFRERARYNYDAGVLGNALSELAIMNSILRDHAGWCVPDTTDNEVLGNLVGKVLAHSKTLMYSIELESGEPFAGIDDASTLVSLAVTNSGSGECTLSLSGPVGVEATMRIYSVSGRLVSTVFDGRLSEGGEIVVWSGLDESARQTASGVYFALVESGGQMQTAKLVYIR